MIKTYEHKVQYELSKSFTLFLDSAKCIPGWHLVKSDIEAGMIEWKQKRLLGLSVSKIRVYLKQPRPNSTLVTVYVNRPLQFIDPFNMCERVFNKLVLSLNVKLQE
jgi:hypothetical protein